MLSGVAKVVGTLLRIQIMSELACCPIGQPKARVRVGEPAAVPRNPSMSQVLRGGAGERAVGSVIRWAAAKEEAADSSAAVIVEWWSWGDETQNLDRSFHVEVSPAREVPWLPHPVPRAPNTTSVVKQSSVHL